MRRIKHQGTLAFWLFDPIGGFMYNAAQKIFAIISMVASVICFTGCGGEIVDYGYDGPTSRIVLDARGANRVNLPEVFNNTSLDISGGTTGSGGELDGGESIYDAATVSCQFLTSSVTPGTEIDVVSNSSSCASLNKCIVCTTESTGTDCTISCAGDIPSNTETAADYMEVTVRFTSFFQTDMPSPDGAIRFDGIVTNWAEFDPSDATDGIVYDRSGCDGDPDMWVLDDDPVLNGTGSINAVTTEEWHRGMSIDVLDPSPDGSGIGDCTVSQEMTAKMYFAGADTPGATIDLTRDSIYLYSTICDTPTNCPQGGAPEPVTCTSTAAANWNVDGTWDCGHVPVEDDNVIVAHAVTIPSGYTIAKINDLTINTGVTLTQQNTAQQAISGNMSISGTLAHTIYSTSASYLDWRVDGNLTVEASGAINVDGKGFKGGTAPNTLPRFENGYGDGKGYGQASSGGGGAAYGGIGGKGEYNGANGAAGGSIYGDAFDPDEVGSGGGSGYWNSNVPVGGYGGGLIMLDVGGTLTLSGTISAKGAASALSTTSFGSGGGSGGGINITAGTVTGASSLYANGGNYGGAAWATYQGGAGGGGRIKISANSGSLSGVLYVNNGTNNNQTTVVAQYGTIRYGPSDLQTEGQTNPTAVAELTPEFTAVNRSCRNSTTSNTCTGQSATQYRIQVVSSRANFDAGPYLWDSGMTALGETVSNGAAISPISYAGSALSGGGTYYWRIKFYEADNTEHPWSADQTFTLISNPSPSISAHADDGHTERVSLIDRLISDRVTFQ